MRQAKTLLDETKRPLKRVKTGASEELAGVKPNATDSQETKWSSQSELFEGGLAFAAQEKAEAAPVENARDFVHEILGSDVKPYDKENLLIMHWNVNSLNPKLDRSQFLSYLASKKFDILCFNETKYNDKRFRALKIHEHPLWKDKFHQYWYFSTKKPGYSGVCVLSRLKALSVRFGMDNEIFDTEGRIITLEFEEFFLVSVYTPCSGMQDQRFHERINSWEVSFSKLLHELKAIKPVVVVGDLNVAHTEMDVSCPHKSLGIPGFFPQERSCFDALLKSGFKDAFREMHPSKVVYTWWDQRSYARYKNEGWRIDYCVVDHAAMERVMSVDVRTDVFGSDHCPVEVTFRYTKNPQNKNETKEIPQILKEFKELL